MGEILITSAPEEYQKRVFEFFDQLLMPKQLR